MRESATIKGRWKIEKYASEADFRAGKCFEAREFDNLLVTTGLAELGKLLTGTGSPTAFNSANAYIGVGDSSTAAAVGQTDLQAATNKLRKAMDGSYPSTPTNGVYTWRATFASGDANFAWNEFGVFNASAAGVMLNRAVSAQGTKASGQVWVATVTLTLS